MNALRQNDFPEIDSGLTSMWAFAGDTTRFVYKNNMTEFVEDAHETARTLSTSFYGAAMLLLFYPALSRLGLGLGLG